MAEPLVSIIVPVYNAEGTLSRCLDSILGQQCADFELILVNDGSTDGSGALCDATALRDARVRVIHRQNGGELVARNTALDTAEGRYVQFVDNDDWLEPDITGQLVEAVERDGAGMAVCSFRRHYADGRPPEDVALGHSGRQPADWQLMEFARGLPDAMLRFGAPWNKLFRRDVIERHALRFEAARTPNLDALFNCAYLGHIQSCQVVDLPLYNYAMPDGRSTSTTRYRPEVFETTKRVYAAFEAVIGPRLTPKEQAVFNRHFLDKTLIALRMLGRANTVYTGQALYEKLRGIADDPMLRDKLRLSADYGTQENAALELLRQRDYDRLYVYATEGGAKMYHRWQ